ncbi:MAG TPA: plastocyanin/azurin family copper-binding protein [Symbiobacteriaceae bacterium]|nr:plastocyanin/azurin family copper-binding protein [Symbiobacteriaceae bacterium]
MNKRNLLISFMLVALLIAASGCAKEAEVNTGVQSGEVTITMKNMKFTPDKVSVRRGTKVTFVNKDAILHDAVQVYAPDFGKAEPGFDSKEIMPGKSFTVTMDEPGEYPILCSQAAHFTAGMMGSITVVE